MKHIGIIVDSTTLLSESLKNHPHIYSVPLEVIVNNKHYLDGIELKPSDWLNYLENDATMTTSQPSIAKSIEALKSCRDQQYEHVFVLPVTKQLSGTHSGFLLAQKEVQLKQVTIYDTFSIAGTIGYMVEVLLELAQQDASLETMMAALDEIRDHNATLIYPKTLKRLIKSGRMNKTVGGIASFLKLKPILVFKNKGLQIEKLDVVRTEKKVIQVFLDYLNDMNVNDEWIIYSLQINPVEFMDQFEERLKQVYPLIEIRHEPLPGVIATHVGLGVYAIQLVKKYRGE